MACVDLSTSLCRRGAQVLRVVMGLALCAVMPAAWASDPFVAPSPEELKMTELPGYPGVAAVILFQDRYTDEPGDLVYIYRRIKILTEEGKKYANVELEMVHGDGTSLDVKNIAARTVHPDGTILPFEGKPTVQTTEKGKGFKLQSKVFTLPDVTVGSIVEYSYVLQASGLNLEPTWLLQDDLFVKSEHFKWHIDTRWRSDRIGVSKFLPPGVDIKKTKDIIELTAADIAPIPREQYMPPTSSLSYRVVFYSTSYVDAAAFWDKAGTAWADARDAFLDGGPKLKEQTEKIVAGATTEDEKLRRIYAAVMALENTNYTRERDRREDKAEGIREIKTVADILTAKRSNKDALNDLFVGMARSVGFKAYDMMVSDRSASLFDPNLPSFDQFYARIAIVVVDGNEKFFDPGAKYCPYGQLAWQHTLAEGLRQIDKTGGKHAALVNTPGPAYTANDVARVADLRVDDKGNVTGTMRQTLSGAAALAWRQSKLLGDMEALRHGLVTDLEGDIPKSLEVKLTNIEHVDEYEVPLVATYQVTGTLGTMTGKRMVLPADVFESRVSAVFPAEKREAPVYFHYPIYEQDAVRLTFAPSFQLEAVPTEVKLHMGKTGAYTMSFSQSEHSVLMRREFAFAQVLVPKAEYADLRGFFQQFEAKDQESVVLKLVPTAPQ